MSTERTTLTINKLLLNAAKEKSKENGESLTDFISRAILNQLEKEDYSRNIRYEMRLQNE